MASSPGSPYDFPSYLFFVSYLFFSTIQFHLVLVFQKKKYIIDWFYLIDLKKQIHNSPSWCFTADQKRTIGYCDVTHGEYIHLSYTYRWISLKMSWNIIHILMAEVRTRGIFSISSRLQNILSCCNHIFATMFCFFLGWKQ